MNKIKLKLLLPLFLSTTSIIAISCQSNNINQKLNKSENNKPGENINNNHNENDKNTENKPLVNQKNEVNSQGYEHENSSQKYELFSFPKPKYLDKNIALSHEGEIKDIKSVFDYKKFPDNVVLLANENNENLIKRYFNEEYRKVIRTFYAQNLENNLPKWANINFESAQRPDSKIIPDLFARIKDENNLYKLNQRIMLSYAENNEIDLINNKELIYKKDITNYLNKPFLDRKLNINILFAQNQSNYGFNFVQKNIMRFEVDIEKLLLEKGKESSNYLRLTNYDLPILYQVYINNDNELILKAKLDADFNKDFTFDYTNIKQNIVINKYSAIIDIFYKTIEENDEIFSLEKITYKNQIEPKLTSNGLFYSNDKNLSFTNGKRIVEYENQSLFKDIRKRVFVVGGGTSIMLAKVKPSDENDQRYYFITNRHVSDNLKNHWENSQVMKKFLIYDFDDNKVRNASDDISVNVEKDYFNFNFWEAKDQTRRDGRIENDNRKDADISISIIDIKQILAKAKAENKTKIINYLENWKNLKALKLSKKTRYLNENDYVKLYLSSFPVDSHAGFSGRRYREHIINRIENIQLSDQDQRFLTYGHFRTFIQSDDLSKNQKYDLISGGSGSVVYDENGDMVALFMQNIGDDSYGFGLLSNFEYDYFGYETSNNPKSFKNKLKKAMAEQPDKFEYFEI